MPAVGSTRPPSTCRSVVFPEPERPSSATLSYQGLAANFVGLYQFNVVVPNIANNDLAPVGTSLNGAAGPQTLFLAVKQ